MVKDQNNNYMKKKSFVIIGVLIITILSYYITEDNMSETIEDVSVDTVFMEEFNLSQEEMMKGVQGDLTWEQSDSITKNK